MKPSPLGSHYLVLMGFSQRKESPDQSMAQGTLIPVKKGRGGEGRGGEGRRETEEELQGRQRVSEGVALKAL